MSDAAPDLNTGGVAADNSPAIGKNGSIMHARQHGAEWKESDDFPDELIRRDEWMDFRDPNRISNKAGVVFSQLPKVVVKELCDNALDAGAGVEFGLVEVTE